MISFPYAHTFGLARFNQLRHIQAKQFHCASNRQMSCLHLRRLNADSPVSRRTHGADHFKWNPHPFVQRTGLFDLFALYAERQILKRCVWRTKHRCSGHGSC